MQTLRDRLLDEMRSMRTVDCHSHTELRRDYYAMPRDLFTMRSYFNREIAAQMGVADYQYGTVYGGWKSDEERWSRLSPPSRARGIPPAGDTTWSHTKSSLTCLAIN